MQLRIKAEYNNGLLCVDTTDIPDDLQKAAVREAYNYASKNHIVDGVVEFARKVVYKVIRDLKE